MIPFFFLIYKFNMLVKKGISISFCVIIEHIIYYLCTNQIIHETFTGKGL